MSMPVQPVGYSKKNILLTVAGVVIVILLYVAFTLWQDKPEPKKADFTRPAAASGSQGFRMEDDAPKAVAALPYDDPKKQEERVKEIVKSSVKEERDPDVRDSILVGQRDIGGGGSGQQASAQPSFPGQQLPSSVDEGSGTGSKNSIEALGSENAGGMPLEKQGFINAGKKRPVTDAYVLNPLMPRASKYIIQTGTKIDGKSVYAVHTDLPGEIYARTDRAIMDSVTQSVVLLPAGSVIYGVVNNQTTYGQRYMQPRWERIHFPCGEVQPLGSMAATGADGGAGIKANVDRHAGRMAAAVGGSALFTIIGQAGALFSGGGDVTIGSIGAGAAGDAMEGIGSRMVRKELELPSTLYLNPGDPVSLIANADIPLPAYRGTCKQ